MLRTSIAVSVLSLSLLIVASAHGSSAPGRDGGPVATTGTVRLALNPQPEPPGKHKYKIKKKKKPGPLGPGPKKT